MLPVRLDVSALHRPHLTGIGIYTRHLGLALAQHPDVQLVATYKASRFKYRRALQQWSPVPATPFLPGWTGHWGPRGEVLLCPDFWLTGPYPGPRVVTIHDWIGGMPELVAADSHAWFTIRMQRLLERQRPDHILVVSDTTRRDLLAHYPTYANRISVTWLGVDHVQPARHPLPPGITPPYLLTVGTIERRKNLPAVLDVFALLADRYPSLKLVVAGGTGFDHEASLSRLQEHPHRDRIHRLGFVSDDVLHSLYQHAAVNLYLSTYEGFGLPPLEGMRLGAPTLVSTGGALAEVAAQGTWAFAPDDVRGVANATELLLTQPEQRQALVARSQAFVRQFTWAACAERTVAVLREIQARGRHR